MQKIHFWENFFEKKFPLVNGKLTFLCYFFPSLAPARHLGGSCSPLHLCVSIASAYHKKIKSMLISGKFFPKDVSEFETVSDNLSFIFYFHGLFQQ
ncbi:MAG: hypothetical protein LBP31_01965 [Holosporales bacterium]|nr:hypothetical protein [Holosporales bacterium]